MGSTERLFTSGSVFYAEAAASSSASHDRDRHENVYLISGQGGRIAIGVNDAVLASVSPLCKDVLLQHADKPEPPDDR